MAQVLRRSSLDSLAAHTISSTWPSPKVGIVHLGLGNFHRAHEAVYTEQAVVEDGGDWGIIGVTLRGSTSKRDHLRDQGGLYTVVEKSKDGESLQIIRILQDVLALPHDIHQLLDILSRPEIKIVSLTVTEKGYCRNTRSGEVDLADAAIQHDLANPETPTTVPGILFVALKSRRVNPFTVLSCDNLSHNGAALRKVVVSYARQLDHEIANWISESVAFPSTMVDRIVPSTTEDDVHLVERISGYHDELPVPCEPFRQWVIEDNFPLGHPAWHKFGAQFVSDVTPFEIAKLRMLNGSHSALAYISLLSGFATIDQAIAHPPLRQFIYDMLTEEIIPTLQVPESSDLFKYRDDLLDRFANPALKHRTAQIAMDGSQKVPLRLLSTINESSQLHRPCPRLALSVAAWLTHFRGHSDDSVTYNIVDPMAETLTNVWDALLGLDGIFSTDLLQQGYFAQALQDGLRILQDGTLRAIERYNQSKV
ncbi:mannitol dehydrogenase domain protein [Sistotremastrum suecicum HHB10207 ss-3]|uniref:mannitol 2-dehydrogenase n=1 Tax=Sistotremastrum suecicum HHB10207 ss-3 TaxID=1314776 RepID=A0A166DBT2_9AGAM|nr:mannitol dehydrogenase domain protein [Sistotremastrum suecicum HHB10207 ss-3]